MHLGPEPLVWTPLDVDRIRVLGRYEGPAGVLVRGLKFANRRSPVRALGAALAGASGYVLKDIRSAALVDAIRASAAGRTVQSAQALRTAAQAAAPVTGSAPASPDADLTYRERQVLDLIADGLTNREIGERLGLAEKTVKNYVSGLLAKLGMVRRTQAAVYGAEHRRGS